MGMTFNYKFKDTEGRVKKGRTNAVDKIEAQKRLVRMGIDLIAVWTDNDPEPPYEPTPPEWAKTQVQPPTNAPESQEEAKFKGPPPEVVASLDKFKNHNIITKEVLAAATGTGHQQQNSVKKHKFLMGNYEEVRKVVDSICEKGGTILHFTTTPDTHGNIILAISLSCDS